MKKCILLLATIAALAPCFPLTSNAATQVYDLKTDWSDTQNPNGAWSYRFGEWLPLSNNPFPWTDGMQYISRTGESGVVPGYLELGDIFVGTAFNGVVVRWTAPASATINISGTAWPTAEFGSQYNWTLNHNGSALSSGVTIPGFPQPTRDLPYDLSSGSGGATAVQNIAVQAGDRIELVLQTWEGSETAVNFTITLTPDSFDPVAAIENLALTVVHMNLQNGIENSLDSKLDAALDALVDANFNNDGAACNSLAAFTSAVEAQRGKKITNAQADQLIASAQQIKAMLNCNN